MVKTQLSLYQRGVVAAHTHLGTEWNFRHATWGLDHLSEVCAVVVAVNLSEGQAATTVGVGSLEGEMRSLKILLVDFILNSFAFVVADGLRSWVLLGLHWVDAEVLLVIVCFVAFCLLLLLRDSAQDGANFIFLLLLLGLYSHTGELAAANRVVAVLKLIRKNETAEVFIKVVWFYNLVRELTFKVVTVGGVGSGLGVIISSPSVRHVRLDIHVKL